MESRLTPEDYIKMIDELFINQFGPLTMEIDGNYVTRWYDTDGNIVMLKSLQDTLHIPYNLFDMIRELLDHYSNKETKADIRTYFKKRYGVDVGDITSY
jgi:hypothetical protein